MCLRDRISKILDDLENTKLDFRTGRTARLETILEKLELAELTDATQLIRLHESLLFLRAYPRTSKLLEKVNYALETFACRVNKLHEQGADLFALTEPQVSGISGSELTGVFTYNVARYLAHAFPSQVSIDWAEYDRGDQFSLIMRRFMPLLEEDSYVESYYPILQWLRTAMGRNQNDLVWIIGRFEDSSMPETEKAELFDSLRLWIRWRFEPNGFSRTDLRWSSKPVFFHDSPLLGRKDVSIKTELEGPPIPITALSKPVGRKLLHKGRAAMSMRYRELHGFTFGDNQEVWRADAGRGLEIFIWGVPPEKRLPTLAYHSLFIVKNGLPIGYAEALSICERSEIGLNLFYTFRDGESAWVYARLLKSLQQLLRVKVFSIDPYQLGHHNSEGLNAGAFWFYRKLGFRPIVPELARMVEIEEARIVNRPGYRTPTSRLANLSSGHLLYDNSGAATSEWDNFHVRTFGLAIQKLMAASARGDERRLRERAVTSAVRMLNIDASTWNQAEQNALSIPL